MFTSTDFTPLTPRILSLIVARNESTTGSVQPILDDEKNKQVEQEGQEEEENDILADVTALSALIGRFPKLTLI